MLLDVFLQASKVAISEEGSGSGGPQHFAGDCRPAVCDCGHEVGCSAGRWAAFVRVQRILMVL
jgi:hypothetical protein